MRHPFARFTKRPVPTAAGRPPRTPPGERIYAVGDVHGRRDLLAAMTGLIDEDRRTRPAPAAVRVIYLGDYVDRGPDSRGVIEDLCRAARGAEPPVCLIGNHDWWFRDFLDGGELSVAWLGSGGDATLASYGIVDLPPAADPDRWAGLRQRLRRRVPGEHRRFLHALQPSHRCGDYLFAHAGIRPGLPLEHQDPRDLMFIREPFLSEPGDLGVVVVHGHTIVQEPELRRHRIAVDTGACWTDRLTAAVLEDDKLRFLSTKT